MFSPNASRRTEDAQEARDGVLKRANFPMNLLG
jgi:hypothetical protein